MCVACLAVGDVADSCGQSPCSYEAAGSLSGLSETRAVGSGITIVSDSRAIEYHLEAGDNWRWNAEDPLGTGVVVTYSFTSAPDLPALSDYNPYGASSYSAFSASQRASFRAAAAEFMAVSGLIFVEVTGDAMIDIFNADGTGVGGWAGVPYVTAGYEPDIKLVIDAGGTYAPGTYAYYTLLHELGHAVGLDHTFTGSYQLSAGIDSTRNTVMSYNYDSAAEGLQWIDIQALQNIYGAPEGAGLTELSYREGSDRLIARGSSGNDVIVASSVVARNRLDGEAGDDRLTGSSSSDVIRGDDGTDLLEGDGGRDFLRGGRGDDSLSGGAGNDYLNGGSGADTLSGGDGDDYLDGRTGADLLMGGAGEDILDGWRNDDRLDGGAGNDILIGGRGSDTLTGGSGADRFVFAADSGSDRVTDFEMGLDVLDLRALGTEFAALTIEAAAGAARIATGGIEIFLEGIAPGAVTEDAFAF